MIPKIALTYKWEKETLDYLKLPGVTLSFAQTITLDDQIKIIKGGGTITLLAQSVNISKINGLAFLTNPSTDLRKFKGFKLSVKAAGKTLVGWVKAAGTGEVLGGELVTNGDMAIGDPPTGWTARREAIVSASGGGIKIVYYNQPAPGVNQPITTVIGSLYKYGLDVKELFGITQSYLRFGSSPVIGTPFDLAAEITGISDNNYRYFTSTVVSQYFHIQNVAGGALSYGIYDNATLQQVTAPSALGCTIVSTFEGAEQSWTSDDGINPNSLTFDIDITNS